MKIDRILEIIIYLLNHDNVSARYLAEHFHVSIRTIERDMISISSAGIPVYSSCGKCGGYSILPTYKIKNTNIKNDEQQLIIKALESLSTSYTSDTLSSLIEKYNAIIEKKGGQKVFFDFSVSKENKQVQDMNTLLEQAITNKNFVSFNYCNAQGEKSLQYAEPLAIHYKWYSWYLFAYSKKREDYRTFKVARMENLVIDEHKSSINHGDIKKLMDDSENEYYKTCIHIEVHFNKNECNLMKEYFPDCPIEHIQDDKYRIFIDVPSKERLWKALLLSFGNKITIVDPEDYKNELIQTAKSFLSNYDMN